MPVGVATRGLGAEVAGDRLPAQPGLIASANRLGRARTGAAQAQPVVRSHGRPELWSRVRPCVSAGVRQWVGAWLCLG